MHSFLSLSRRAFVVQMAGAMLAGRSIAEEKSRTLRFVVRNEFGEAPVSNVERLLESVGDSLWRHCPNSQLIGRGFSIYRNDRYPITHFRQEDERIVVGLCTRDLSWSQYSYQFAHEFAHCLIDHTHEDQRRWHVGPHANLWLDESLCETASLFALRALGKSWQTQPPYANWASYAKHLTEYAQRRLDDPAHQLPADMSFEEWFRRELPTFRDQPTQREKNTIVAAHFLPLFEAEPAGWETLTAIKRGVLNLKKPLVEHLREWEALVDADRRQFVGKLIRRLLPE